MLICISVDTFPHNVHAYLYYFCYKFISFTCLFVLCLLQFLIFDMLICNILIIVFSAAAWSEMAAYSGIEWAMMVVFSGAGKQTWLLPVARDRSKWRFPVVRGAKKRCGNSEKNHSIIMERAWFESICARTPPRIMVILMILHNHCWYISI